GRPSEAVARLAFLNAALETGIENPLDVAIVAAGREGGLSHDDVRKVDEIPYDFSRKRLTIVVREQGSEEHLIITKGAFASVLAICALEPKLLRQCERYYEAMSADGFRVLALATQRSRPKSAYAREDEREMTLVGFLLFLDPP